MRAEPALPLSRIFLYHLYLPEGGQGKAGTGPLVANGFTKRYGTYGPLK